MVGRATAIEVSRVFFQSHFSDYTAGHRECGNAASTDHRVDFLSAEHVEKFSEDNAANGIEYECNSAEAHDEKYLNIQETFSSHGTADGNTKYKGYQVGQFVLSAVGQVINNTGFFKNVTEHKSTDKSNRQRRYNACYDNDHGS